MMITAEMVLPHRIALNKSRTCHSTKAGIQNVNFCGISGSSEGMDMELAGLKNNAKSIAAGRA
jgi:hypothetical protein